MKKMLVAVALALVPLPISAASADARPLNAYTAAAAAVPSRVCVYWWGEKLFCI